MSHFRGGTISVLDIKSPTRAEPATPMTCATRWFWRDRVSTGDLSSFDKFSDVNGDIDTHS